MAEAIPSRSADVSASDAGTHAPSRPWHSLWMRAVLLAGCTAVVATAAALGGGDATARIEPQLARLLRGMALLKAAIVLAVLGALLWRLRWPLPPIVAAGYLAGAWSTAAASVLVWQLDHLVPAAVLFHAGLLGLLIAGFLDHGRSERLERR